MLIKQDQLCSLYEMSAMDILDSSTYLLEKESSLSPIAVPVLENQRLGVYTVSYRDIKNISEDYGYYNEDALHAIAEASGIDMDRIAVAIDESDIILDPEIVNEFAQYTIIPESDYSVPSVFVEACLTNFIESDFDEDYLDIMCEPSSMVDTLDYYQEGSTLRKIKKNIKKNERNENIASTITPEERANPFTKINSPVNTADAETVVFKTIGKRKSTRPKSVTNKPSITPKPANGKTIVLHKTKPEDLESSPQNRYAKVRAPLSQNQIPVRKGPRTLKNNSHVDANPLGLHMSIFRSTPASKEPKREIRKQKKIIDNIPGLSDQDRKDIKDEMNAKAVQATIDQQLSLTPAQLLGVDEPSPKDKPSTKDEQSTKEDKKDNVANTAKEIDDNNKGSSPTTSTSPTPKPTPKSSGGSTGGNSSGRGSTKNNKSTASSTSSPAPGNPQDPGFLSKLKKYVVDKPREFLAKMAAKLRNVYKQWLDKANKEANAGKASLIKRVAAKILQAVDYIMKKIQGSKE